MNWDPEHALEDSKLWFSWLVEHLPSFMLEGMEDESVGFLIDALRHFKSSGGANLSLDGEIALIVADRDEALIAQIGELVNYNIVRLVMRSIEGDTPLGFQSLRIARLDFGVGDRSMKAGLSTDCERRSQLRQSWAKRMDDISVEDFDALLERFERVFLSKSPIEDVLQCLSLFYRNSSEIKVEVEVLGSDPQDDVFSFALVNRRSSQTGFFYHLLRTIHFHGFKLLGVQSIYLPKDGLDESRLSLFQLASPKGVSKMRSQTLRGRVLESVSVAQWFEFENPMNQELMEESGFSIHHTMLLRSMQEFVHQLLSQVNAYVYTPMAIHEAFIKYPGISTRLISFFRARFNPVYRKKKDLVRKQHSLLVEEIEAFDSGIAVNDDRFRVVLRLATDFVDHILKTNYYVLRRSALSFRLDSGILLKVPLLDRDHLYPEVPDAIFFIKGKNFIAFNIRFRELARGGVRTLMPMDADKRAHQHRDVFRECYLLAYTQQKKNKDIPEGGAKTVVFVKKYSAFERDLEVERSIAVKLMDKESLSASMEERRLTRVRRLLFDAQQSFCDALLDLLVWDDQKHVLVTTNVVDYHGKEELVFLGPDENMLNQMIEWISLRSEERGYRVGLSFMSGKKELGINHKAYGVTSLGVHEYLKEILRSKGFDKASFTVKMSGGPDGDVAGNQLINLIKDFGDRVAVLGVVDGTGLLMDPGGISQQELKRLFEVGQGVSSFDPTFLGIGACLLLIQEKRDSQRGVQEILCLRCESTGVKEVWLGASEANRFYHQELLKLKTDVFLPCGGRPRTLNRKNWRQFCDDAGEPSARIIVEGANLYLDDQAREELQSLGVLIVKDASANKCGVICSSYEILAGLICGPEEFKGIKEDLVVDVMAKLVARAKKEARLLIGSEQGDAIALSDRVSDAINRWTDLIIQELQCSCSDKEYQALLLEVVRITAPETLKKNYTARIITLPKLYKDAMIASTLASSLVYHRGVDYQPKLIHSLMREVEEGLLGD